MPEELELLLEELELDELELEELLELEDDELLDELEEVTTVPELLEELELLDELELLEELDDELLDEELLVPSPSIGPPPQPTKAATKNVVAPNTLKELSSGKPEACDTIELRRVRD